MRGGRAGGESVGRSGRWVANSCSISRSCYTEETQLGVSDSICVCVCMYPIVSPQSYVLSHSIITSVPCMLAYK